MEKLETIEHRGYSINVYRDDHPGGPEEWGDENLFLVGFHREFYVQKEGFSEGTVQAIFNRGRYEDDSIHHEAREIMRKYWVFPLEAYIHSGVSLYLAGDRARDRWDSSTLGAVFVAKSEWKRSAKAEDAARGLVQTWNQYINGEVYGYMIETPDGEEEGGCWGFYGDDGIKQITEEAKAEIDAMKAERDAKRAAAWARVSSGAVRVYDTGAKGPIDRYTVIDGSAAYGMSSDPKSPQGFNQYIGESSKLAIPALGKKISAGKIPAAVREAIIDRIIN